METTTATKSNVEIVQQAFTDFGSGNIEGILNVCTDDLVWSSYDNPAIPFAQSYYGKEGAAEFFSNLAGAVEYTAFEPREFFACSDRVFVKVYHAATVKITGKSFAHETLMEFVFHGNKLCRFFAYTDTFDQARAFSQ